jgi:hypothetical protein
MSFIKHGGIDGKIVSIVDEKELTDEQKKSAKDLSEKTIKTSDQKSNNKN